MISPRHPGEGTILPLPPLPLLDNAHTHLPCALEPSESEGGYVSLCSTRPSDWEQAAELSRAGEGRVIPSFGIHPWHIDENSSTLPESIHGYLKEFPHAGLGETGLDKSRRASASLDVQKELLATHVKLAMQYERTISLHCVKAWGTLLEILEEHRPPKMLLHGWNGHADMIARFARLGCFFSINIGALESENAAEWLRDIPESRLLLETDEYCGSLDTAFELLCSHLNPASKDALRQRLHGNFCALFDLPLTQRQV